MVAARLTAEDMAEAAARVRADGPVPVSKAAKLVPADNRRGHVGAGVLVRWIVHGRRGVRLDGARFSGKTWWTSAAALERFWGQLAAVEAGRVEAARAVETTGQRDARAEAWNREMDELVGVL